MEGRFLGFSLTEVYTGCKQKKIVLNDGPYGHIEIEAQKFDVVVLDKSIFGKDTPFWWNGDFWVDEPSAKMILGSETKCNHSSLVKISETECSTDYINPAFVTRITGFKGNGCRIHLSDGQVIEDSRFKTAEEAINTIFNN